MPEAIQAAAAQNGREHFGQINGTSVAGPNKQARLQTAKAVIERFVPDDVRSGRVPQQPANETKIPRRLTTPFIQADQSMYGVPPQELLSEMHSQLDLLHLPSAFKVHPALKGLW